MLYIVATPIGNLDELTFRALEVLKNADIIAAEDTRHSAVLLNKYGITAKTVAYHKFNEKASTAGLISALKSGKTVAVISDAGMPAVSDPGYAVIEAAIENGIEFTVVSGACAAVNALVLSGLNTRTFSMLGFLPEKKTDRKRFLQPYKSVPGTLVIYSSVHDITKDLQFLTEELGGRRVAVCRELTKKFETVTRGRLGDLPEIVEKGEFVIVVEGATENPFADLSVEQHILRYVRAGESVRDAVKKTAFDRGTAKSEIYAVAEKMKSSGELPSADSV